MSVNAALQPLSFSMSSSTILGWQSSSGTVFFCKNVIILFNHANFTDVERSIYMLILLSLNISMLMFDRSSTSSLDLSILILCSGRFVLIKETPEQHFLSHISGNTIYPASRTDR